MRHSKTEHAAIEKTRIDFIRSHPELSTAQLAEILGLSRDSIYSFVRKHVHGDDSRHVSRWTKEQESFMVEYADKPISWLDENMPGEKHTQGSIQTKRAELGLTNGPVPWTDEQISFLKAHADKTSTWISEHMPEPKKGVNSVNHMRKKNLGMGPGRAKPWTEEQYDFLRAHQYDTASWIIENMPGPKRTIGSVRAKRKFLGLTETPEPWTDKQLDFLKSHADKSAPWISEHMPEPKKNWQTVNYIRRSLNLQRIKVEHWTDEQTNFLKAHADKDSKWISENMPEPKKDEASVTNKRQREKLTCSKRDDTVWTKEELKFIEDHMDISVQWIVDNKPGMKRTANAVGNARTRIRKENHTLNTQSLAWTEEETTFVESNMDKSIRWIIDNKPGPKRTANAISDARTQIRKRNLASRAQSPAWTKEETDFIRTNVDKPAKWIADNKPGPKRTVNAIDKAKADIRKETHI